jgi:acetaldehyde dehydrogenase/alcohol dehydrogenase
LGIPRRITVRVILFAFLIAAVPVGAFYAIRWYAYDNWYVAVQKQEIVVKQGRPGGVLWFHPRVVDNTRTTTSQLLPSDVAQIRAGVQELDRIDADVIIAVGGGSVIDAAKAMRLFHESPQLNLHELSLPFLDARKRIASFPQTEHTIRLIAVPTTAGTGSEVSPAAVVTVGNRKVTLVDYSLVPDIAVVDPTLTLTMPPEITADTGIDALTHALEAGVSIFASPFTDAFCMQAINLILDALPRAYRDGSDLEARSAMANAATIAGLAFSNAFVGLNHALAHAVGARFGIAHGRANAIFLPHVLRYNSSLPTKFMPAPGYSAYVAPQKYAQIAWILGIGGSSESDRRERLFDRVQQLLADVGEPATLAELGIAREEFEACLPELAKTAFTDPSIRTNPRIPLLREIIELLQAGFGG